MASWVLGVAVSMYAGSLVVEIKIKVLFGSQASLRHGATRVPETNAVFLFLSPECACHSSMQVKTQTC